MRRTRSRLAPHPPVSPQIPPRDGPICRPPRLAAAGAARPSVGRRAPPPLPDRAPQPRHCQAQPGRARPGRAGSPGPRRRWAEVGSAIPSPSVFPFVFFRFLSFRFVSFLPPVTGGEQLHGTATPPCQRVTRRTSPSSPFCTASPSAPGLRRAPAEHPGTARRGVPRPRGGSPGPPGPSKGSAPPRRGEQEHRRRGGGSRARYFVVIKILPPRRARIGAEARPRGAGRARRAGECIGAGASRGLPGCLSRVVTVRQLRRLPALPMPSFPRLPPLCTPRRNSFTGGAARERNFGPRAVRHSSGAPGPAAGPVPVSPARRIVPTASLQTPRHKSRRVDLSSPLPARSRCRPPSSRPEAASSGQWTGKSARRNQA